MGTLARRIWKEWLRGLVVVLAVTGCIRSAVADWNDVPTGSMKPTILEGDRIVVNKLAYDLRAPLVGWRLLSWADPQRGDIVILRSPTDGRRLVKRVVGVPGDRLAMVGDRLMVNGTPVILQRKAVVWDRGRFGNAQRRLIAVEVLGRTKHTIMITPQIPASRSFPPTMIPRDRYFVMGDNRDESADSRWFGVVARGNILGRAFAVAGSVDLERRWHPRWDRFFTGLN